MRNDVIDKIEHNKYSDKSCTSSAFSSPSNSQTVNIPLNKIGAFAKNSFYLKKIKKYLQFFLLQAVAKKFKSFYDFGKKKS